MNTVRRRLAVAFLLIAGLIGFGTLGFLWIGRGRWDAADCAYMTVISITTVGFGEVLDGLQAVPGARAFPTVVVLVGFGVGGFALSTLTALIVEGDLARDRRRKRMRKQIAGLTHHVIVCGVGTTGRHVVDELVATRTPVVAVDMNEEKLEALAKSHPPGSVLYVVGDATEDFVLVEAGIVRARGLVAALPDDKHNLFVVISAREANPDCRIVARSGDVRAFDKLRKAGANAVVSPNYIGGMRLASEMVRPHVVEFLDEMLLDRSLALRIEEVKVPEDSPFVGKTVQETHIRDETDALVLAIRDRGRGAFRYNPRADAVVEGGTTLVVLRHAQAVGRLREGVVRGFGR